MSRRSTESAVSSPSVDGIRPEDSKHDWSGRALRATSLSSRRHDRISATASTRRHEHFSPGSLQTRHQYTVGGGSDAFPDLCAHTPAGTNAHEEFTMRLGVTSKVIQIVTKGTFDQLTCFQYARRRILIPPRLESPGRRDGFAPHSRGLRRRSRNVAVPRNQAGCTIVPQLNRRDRRDA